MTLDETIENELKTSDAYFEYADYLNYMRATTTDHTSREQYKEMAVDLIEKGANHRMIAVWLGQYKKLKDAYRGAIELLEQEPKTGHWARQTDDYHDYYECEHCGIAVGLDDIKNYCPNCGAKMVEPRESEDKE